LKTQFFLGKIIARKEIAEIAVQDVGHDNRNRPDDADYHLESVSEPAEPVGDEALEDDEDARKQLHDSERYSEDFRGVSVGKTLQRFAGEVPSSLQGPDSTHSEHHAHGEIQDNPENR